MPFHAPYLRRLIKPGISNLQDAAVPLPTLSLYQMDDDGRLFAVKPEPELPDVEFIQSGLTLTQGNEGQFWYLSHETSYLYLPGGAPASASPTEG